MLGAMFDRGSDVVCLLFVDLDVEELPVLLVEVGEVVDDVACAAILWASRQFDI